MLGVNKFLIIFAIIFVIKKDYNFYMMCCYFEYYLVSLHT